MENRRGEPKPMGEPTKEKTPREKLIDRMKEVGEARWEEVRDDFLAWVDSLQEQAESQRGTDDGYIQIIRQQAEVYEEAGWIQPALDEYLTLVQYLEQGGSPELIDAIDQKREELKKRQ